MVRLIRAADAAEVKRICESSLGHRTDEALIARRIGELSADPAFYLAVWEDEATHAVLGFLQAQTYPLLYGESGWNLIALAVAPEARGTGIGRALLSSLEAHARARGARFVRLNSRVEREDAHGFYLHLGYQCDKTQKRFIRRL